MAEFGIKALSPAQAASDKPHILGFTNARSSADMGLFEVWNGNSSAARVLRVNKDGQVQAVDGSSSAPAYAFEDAKNTGIYRESSGEVVVAVGGAKRLDVGNVVVVRAAVQPAQNNAHDLGTNALRFRDLYLAGNATVGGNMAVAGNVTVTGAITGQGVVPTSRQIIAGTGLQGGGDLSQNRTLSIDPDAFITVSTQAPSGAPAAGVGALWAQVV